MVTGPRPKAPEVRKRKNVKLSAVDVYTDKPVRQPKLPKERPGKDPAWPEATKRWWKMWKKEPITALFSPTDWDYLLDTAVLHAAYWGDGELRYAAELRRRLENFGATFTDRQRLQINYVKEAEKAVSVTADQQAAGSLEAKKLYADIIPITRGKK